MRGLHIAFEGQNGAGKTTVTTGVYKMFCNNNYKAVLVRDPSDSFIGQMVRKHQDILSKEALACLAAADRYENMQTTILPSLLQGKIVLSDRCLFTAYVLNSIDCIPNTFTDNLYSFLPCPDAIIICHANSKLISARLSERSNLSRYERNYQSEEREQILTSRDMFLSRGVRIVDLLTEGDPEEAIVKAYSIILNILKA